MLSNLVIAGKRVPRAAIAVAVLLFCIIALAHNGKKRVSSWASILLPSGPDADYTRGCVDTAGRRTRLLGGTPGFYYFENVWYRDNVFYMFGDDLPAQDAIMSGRTTLKVEKEEPKHLVPDVCLRKSTLWLNEGASDGWNGLWHYYHFAAENILAGFASLATTHWDTPIMPKQLVIPFWGDRGSWHDKWGMNEMVVDAVFGEDVIEPPQWARLEKKGDGWVYFDRIAIVDRWAAHRKTPAADQWNKMAIGILGEKLQPHWFTAARNRLLDYFHIPPANKKTHRLAYINRQGTDRKLPDETHAELLKSLHGLSDKYNVEIADLVLEDLSKEEQIRAIANSTILLGIHGNGLTHEMWLRETATVIEMFPPDTFLRDYETIATALGHRYIAVRNDSIITPALWNAHPGEQHPEHTHDGTKVALSVPFLTGIIRGIVA
ncbi:hypothetical protein Q8F55_007815 [Vanrija albida]|uniref:Glycosyltransferase 61 catalytic domain-containing protein n=1 Tax=Vanrija albida TaxID=181172 RepID=A0ABR3PVH8_9TREE